MRNEEYNINMNMNSFNHNNSSADDWIMCSSTVVAAE